MPNVVIDCFQESTFRYRRFATLVVVDVFRATTTATTALATGRRVFPARTTDEALIVASTLQNPFLVGELGGNMPFGFDLTNSPHAMADLGEIERPMVLLSSSGTELIMSAAGARQLALACFRNFSAVAKWILDNEFEDVAVLGAGTRGQFRIEDQMGCSWVAAQLVDAGYEAADEETQDVIDRWRDEPPEAALESASVAYLTGSDQRHDVDFVLAHIDDLDIVPVLDHYEIVAAAR